MVLYVLWQRHWKISQTYTNLRSHFFFICFYFSFILDLKNLNFGRLGCWCFQCYRPRISSFIWKICPLFGQSLITSLKCFRATFLPSFSYRKNVLGTRLVGARDQRFMWLHWSSRWITILPGMVTMSTSLWWWRHNVFSLRHDLARLRE